jgi:hypothetical protein
MALAIYSIVICWWKAMLVHWHNLKMEIGILVQYSSLPTSQSHSNWETACSIIITVSPYISIPPEYVHVYCIVQDQCTDSVPWGHVYHSSYSIGGNVWVCPWPDGGGAKLTKKSGPSGGPGTGWAKCRCVAWQQWSQRGRGKVRLVLTT